VPDAIVGELVPALVWSGVWSPVWALHGRWATEPSAVGPGVGDAGRWGDRGRGPPFRNGLDRRLVCPRPGDCRRVPGRSWVHGCRGALGPRRHHRGFRGRPEPRRRTDRRSRDPPASGAT